MNLTHLATSCGVRTALSPDGSAQAAPRPPQQEQPAQHAIANHSSCPARAALAQWQPNSCSWQAVVVKASILRIPPPGKLGCLELD
eukprot:CAMPEP_0181193800 /NCGR_PEP_ID=MMETSP1096-20121128/14006_1 /TAXON_ID=156174 ORGANISM="Chrysochromulina ericina, Strain CCMP281" /NCGR_SAMPLE_ID=MMETSP1096 /ASSEMBLY_ACC=CAM_ASM_000453 /LENGTH=85 /DNA_ID=CAMNT_0023283279 /DNA_START=327 /DNA_END=584 /DNA_ORIENTATION=+